MLLERLEIKGFKSFGDKITIDFDEGITGIVGPNGCGKSNVVDAIRWVLGEQRSKTLRSEKMENIIFNGTKKRKALQLAEVELTFSNTKNVLPTEYAQVTITRRYYRSGESEYELNGVKCRLKDITNLFLDTGITSNTYSIIELGMVDDLLNDRENSRRGLFEEAAGISKFKKRKKETLRRLDDADADIERVEDLLFEIDKNLKSLEKQARQAQRYYKLKEEYKTESIQLARANLKRYNDALSSIQQKIDGETDQKTVLSKNVAEVDSKIEKLKSDLVIKEKSLSSSQKSLNDHVNKIRQYESDKKVKNERLRFLNDKEENLREQINQDKKSHDRASFSIDSLVNEKEDSQKTLAEIKSKLETLRDDRDEQNSKSSRLQEEVAAMSELHRAKREEAFQAKKDVEVKEIQIATLKQELDKASTDTSETSASLINFEKRIKDLSKDLDKKKSEFEKLKDEEIAITDRIEDLEKTIEVIRDEEIQIARKLDARQNEYNLTKSLVDNLEGFPEAIKFLKKETSWGKKAPLLSDIIACGEEYRITIENFLEPYMNYYVVDSEAQAFKAVNLLSDAAKGRAHFFILDSFENHHPTPDKIFNNASPATEIVEYEQKYQKLVAYLLDNVYICEGDFKDIPKDPDSIFISKSGKITRHRFSISGGSVGLFEGKKLGRVKNLDKLDKEIKDLQKKYDKVTASLKEKQEELEKLRSKVRKDELEELQIQIGHLNDEYISLTTKQEQYSSLLSSSDVKKDDFLTNIDTLSNEVEKIRPMLKQYEAELADLDSRLEALKEEHQGQSSLASDKSTAYNEANIHYHQQESKIESLDQEISYKKNTLESTRERIVRNSEDLQKNEAEIKQLIENTESGDEVLIAMYSEKEILEKGVNESEKEYYKTRGDIDELEKAGREFQHKRQDLDSLLIELHNKLTDVKVELGSVKERLSVEFNVDLATIGESTEVEKPLSEEEVEQLQLKVEKMRHKIDTMGPINPMAMEAYDEIQERHEFITTQKEDLLKAKESLLTTIAEIDLVAKTTFLEAFDKIKDNFINVFRSLFSEGDDCDLTISDPENPLDSTIEIMAKPKGKKPLTINQLSGGEKTLTATSLLFAIYLLKPAPFCIFDEVDAPLDDANIDKFNQIIHKFSEESQFIIVTHNKRTMASTDVIYGVTMAEQGISKVVPVDLRQLA